MKFQSFLFTSTAALTIMCFTNACGEQEQREGDLAEVQIDDETTITFARMKGGGIAVSELGPVSSPSRITFLARQHATPLEVFLAVAPNEEVPLELEIHHAYSTDAEPRDLAAAESEFRSFTGDNHADDAACSDDYNDWFDPTYDGTGWTHSDYQPGAGFTWWSIHDSDTMNNAQHLITHICNYDEQYTSYMMKLSVAEGSMSYHTLNNIDVGYRGIIYVFNDTRDWYSEAKNQNPSYLSQQNRFKHGIMAP